MPTEPPAAGLLRPFAIGPHRLINNLILAPMAGITDRPYRILCRRFGAGLAVGEMIAANTALWGTPRSRRRLDRTGEPGPLAVQILGAEPRIMAEAARRQAGHGADIIDINMGCPAPKVCRAAAGAALLRDELQAARIIEAVVAAVAVPVTLKIRTGWSPANRNALAIARIAHASGIAALTVHGRTRACTYATPAEHETLSAIRASVPIPLIANGDIATPGDARRILAATGADAIMIGRAARGRPWIFRVLADALRHAADAGADGIPSPPVAWIRDILCEHLDALHAFHGARTGVRVARRHIAWYCRELPGAAALRDRVNGLDTPREQLDCVREFLDAIADPDQESDS